MAAVVQDAGQVHAVRALLPDAVVLVQDLAILLELEVLVVEKLETEITAVLQLVTAMA